MSDRSPNRDPRWLRNSWLAICLASSSCRSSSAPFSNGVATDAPPAAHVTDASTSDAGASERTDPPCPDEPPGGPLGCIPGPPLLPPQVAGPGRIRVAMDPYVMPAEWLRRAAPSAVLSAIESSPYLIFDATPQTERLVHFGRCPAHGNLATFTTDERGTLHLLCFQTGEGGQLLAVHGIVDGMTEVRWQAPVDLRAEPYHTPEAALLALVPGGAFVAFGDFDEHGEWWVKPLAHPDGVMLLQPVFGFFVKGSQLYAVKGATIENAHDWYCYRLARVDLAGRYSESILPVQTSRGLPAFFNPTRGYAESDLEFPSAHDVPNLWAGDARQLRISLPGPAAPPPSCPPMLSISRHHARLYSVRGARSPLGPRSYGEGVVLFQPDPASLSLEGPTGVDVDIDHERPQWGRASCANDECVVVYYRPSWRYHAPIYGNPRAPESFRIVRLAVPRDDGEHR